jgi:hypothetical protein
LRLLQWSSESGEDCYGRDLFSERKLFFSEKSFSGEKFMA